MRLKTLLSASFAAVLWSGAPGVAMADDDSSADVDGGFVSALDQSDAVIIRVPINERGQENTSAAEIRVYQGEAATSAESAAAAFEASTDGTSMPTVSEDSSTNARDSSTYWGWNQGWRGNGWYEGYYYNRYYPTYYNYGYNYNYRNPYYYNYYGSNPYYYGYRYYYYPRYW